MKYGELTLGQIEALVNKLGGVKTVKDILSDAVEVSVCVRDHVFDGDADPFLPRGFTIVEHKKQGKMKVTRAGDDLLVNGVMLDFFLSDNQKSRKGIEGNQFRKELEAKPVLNANLADYLREHPKLIPESWKKNVRGDTLYMDFWGTIYRKSDGSLYVRCLYWNFNRWIWSYVPLNNGFYDNEFAVVLAH